MALEYMIWAEASPIGWNTTMAEIAESLGVSVQAVSAACRRRGWATRLRASMRDEKGLRNTGHFGMGGPEDESFPRKITAEFGSIIGLEEIVA